MRTLISDMQDMTSTHKLAIRAAAHLAAVVDPSLIEQIAGNLIDNAIHHSPNGGTIQIVVADTADTVFVSVRDHGCRIAWRLHPS